MRHALTILLLLAAAAAARGEDLSREAEKLRDSALRTARSSRIRDQQIELLREKMAEVATEELELVVRALAAEEDPPRSLPEVLDLLTGELITRQFGREALEAIPAFPVAWRELAGEELEALLGKALRLEDLRAARAVASVAAGHAERDVRIRAAISLGDLVEYGHEAEACAKELLDLLGDDDPAVRTAACRRAFEAALDPVCPWALEHLGDEAKVAAAIRGEEGEWCPGAEALRQLQALTLVQEELEHRQFLALEAAEREAVTGLYRAWWEEKGAAFPAPGFREAAFRRDPSEIRSVVVRKGREAATFQLWAGMDRTKVRVHVDEIEVLARTLVDFEVHFHVRYMAQGMRSDDGEGYRRNLPVGTRYVLARKAIGCYVLVFQALTGDRVKVTLRFHDPVSGGR